MEMIIKLRQSLSWRRSVDKMEERKKGTQVTLNVSAVFHSLQITEAVSRKCQEAGRYSPLSSILFYVFEIYCITDLRKNRQQ